MSANVPSGTRTDLGDPPPIPEGGRVRKEGDNGPESWPPSQVRCPWCGGYLRANELARPVPRPGDLSICFYCERITVWVLAGVTLVRNFIELLAVPPEERDRLAVSLIAQKHGLASSALVAAVKEAGK